MSIVNFIKKYWKDFSTIIILFFIFNLIEIKIFNGQFDLWGNIRSAIGCFLGFLISKKL
ncbi:hypothetical protein [Cetobacterium sp.]|uniref:hypothetical protein n=1 Tax=Cetobacterium sp. TaxID=2071632 RepID=UPI003F352C25